MTVLSLLGGDWEYQFEDETTTVTTSTQAGTRMLVYNSGPVRTTNEVYSAIAASTDEFQAMGFKNPILPVTPNQYTMENNAFISRASTEWLKEGTIVADWTLAGIAGNNSGRGVLRVPYTGGTNFVVGDIGRRITDGTDFGTLLDYEIEPDGTLVAWVRAENGTPTTGDIFDGTGSLTVVADGGTGASTSHTAADNGQSTYTAMQAIGSVPTATEVYIVQDRVKLANSVDNTGFQFWSTDTGVSLGIVSVLIRTENAGTLLAAGDLEVFARKYTSLYDNFRLNVSAGGFSALPLASAADINNTTGYRRLTGSGGSGTFTVGNGIYEGASWTAATSTGVITAVGGTGAAPIIEYFLVGDLTDFTASAITEYDFVAAADGDAATTGAGAAVVNLLGPTDPASGEGGTVTITLGNTTRDHDNSGTAEPYTAIVDAQSNVAIAKVYERIKYVTRRGGGNTDLFGAGVNIDGEQYRGLEATIYYDNLLSGPFGEGEDITGSNTWTARSLAVRTAVTGEDVTQIYLTVTDQQTSIATVANNDTLSDESSSTIDVDTAGSGGSIVTHAAVKASPFGSFTGTQIFGAAGIDFRNPGAGDSQAYILKDDLGTLRSPPNTITYVVANTRAGDKIYVARDTTTSGVIDKDQFGGMTAVAASSKTVTVAGSVDGEVPAAGYIRIVENALQEEHKYIYTSRTTGASGIFTLTDITADAADATTSDTLLVNALATFQTEGVESGMLVYVAARTSTYEVVSITNETTLVLRLIYGAGGFVNLDTYTINETIQLYAVTDDLFDLIVDAEELVGTEGSPGSISNTLVKTPASDFGTVVQVRQGKDILPFEQNQTQGDGNTTVTTVRTPDSIAV